MLVTGVVFSFMSGTMHPYYTVALAPGIAALVGVGAVAFRRRRAGFAARGTLALAAAAAAAWGFVLLASTGEASPGCVGSSSPRAWWPSAAGSRPGGAGPRWRASPQRWWWGWRRRARTP